MKEPFILERNSLFFCCYKIKSKNYFFFKTKEKIVFLYKGLHTLAYFKTLDEARSWFNKKEKPDIEHSIYDNN